MKYKVEQLTEGIFVVKPKHWWNDPLSSKSVAAAVTEISSGSKVLSVCGLSGLSRSSEFLVIVERK